MRSGALAAGMVAAALVLLPGAGGVAVGADNYELQMARTNTGSFPMRWNPCQTSITYKVNTSQARENHRGRAAAQSRARAEIVKAMGRVEAATGMDFEYTGTTRHIPSGGNWHHSQGPDEEIVIAYVDDDKPSGRSDLLSSGAWGEGGQVYAYEGSTVVIGRGFAVFDADLTRTMKPGFGRGLHRGNLVLHELGHVIGLDHVNDRHQLMHPTLRSSTPDGFAAGDLAGLAALGSDGGCIEDAVDFWPGS